MRAAAATGGDRNSIRRKFRLHRIGLSFAQTNLLGCRWWDKVLQNTTFNPQRLDYIGRMEAEGPRGGGGWYMLSLIIGTTSLPGEWRPRLPGEKPIAAP